jgi:hypothetical protein
MERHFSQITQIAFLGLTDEQRKRVDLALAAAMHYAILERLSGNGAFIGPAARIEPIYAEKLRQLQKLGVKPTQEDSDSAENGSLTKT